MRRRASNYGWLMVIASFCLACWLAFVWGARELLA